MGSIVDIVLGMWLLRCQKSSLIRQQLNRADRSVEMQNIGMQMLKELDSLSVKNQKQELFLFMVQLEIQQDMLLS
jgi:hypothetical protein